MHLSHIPQCTIQNRNVHISVLNGALWDMGQVHRGICEIGLLPCCMQYISCYKWPCHNETLLYHWIIMGKYHLSLSQYKNYIFRYKDFHYKEKTVVRPYFLYKGNPHTDKTSLYWDSPLVAIGGMETLYHDMSWQIVCNRYQWNSYGCLIFNKLQWLDVKPVHQDHSPRNGHTLHSQLGFMSFSTKEGWLYEMQT